MKVCLISLGCPKNLVDSEVIAGHLAEGNLELLREPEGADSVIINTCGFVDSARRESMATIEEICRLKARGAVSAVVVVGCLAQRSRARLKKALPQVDAILPISDYSGLPGLLRKILSKGGPPRTVPLCAGGAPRTSRTDLCRLLLTCPHVAYLRIAEGCNHRCSFCAIPAIRGRLRSKPPEVVQKEVEGLASQGVKELNLVAEDTTDYGRDLCGRSLLPRLLNDLSGVKGIEWIRILYAYPSRVGEDLVEVMAENPKVLNYIDMPIQHISPGILKRMRRGTSPEGIRRVIRMLRERIPGVVLRTSVIVGYPGETREDFELLLRFIEEVRFERLGAFLFSPEEGTAAARLPDPVPGPVAKRRFRRVMALQQSIIFQRNKSLVGTDEDVIVDSVHPGGSALGRTRADAPEIDCAVKLRARSKLESGSILKTRITGFEGYDLLGTPVSEIKKSRR